VSSILSPHPKVSNFFVFMSKVSKFQPQPQNSQQPQIKFVPIFFPIFCLEALKNKKPPNDKKGGILFSQFSFSSINQQPFFFFSFSLKYKQ
jgi:hypothetical protein